MKIAVVVLAFLGSVLAVTADTRIAGGSVAGVGQYPFVGSVHQLYVDDDWWEFTCGSILLTRVIVLTSALYARQGAATPWLWRVRLGSNLYYSGGSLHPVSQIVVHPENNGRYNDLSILRLAEPAVYSDVVRAARIAGPNYILPDGTMVHAAGWGPPGRADSAILLRGDMSIINQQTCANHYSSLENYPNITESMICTGGNNVGTCSNDSGGPVVHGNDIIIGVISFNYICGYDEIPSVHSRVSFYSSWIASFQ